MNLFYHLNDRTYGRKTSLQSQQVEGHYDNGTLKKNPSNFESLIYGNKSIVGRLTLSHKLKQHTGCVNTVSWSSCGRYILTGSDDTHVCIWDWENDGTLKSSFGTGHTANIFCAKFLPFTNNSRIVTCARDGLINVFDLEQSASSLLDMQLKERMRQYRCHRQSVKKLVTFDDNPHLFLSCSNDGTVRRFDLREASTAGKTLVSHKKLQFNSMDKSGNFICVGASDPLVRIYDIRKLPEDISEYDLAVYAKYCPKPLVSLIDKKNSLFSKGHVTGVAFNGSEIIASYSGEGIYLFDINKSEPYSDISSLDLFENLVGDQNIYGHGHNEEDNDDDNNNDSENEEDDQRRENNEHKVEQEMEVETKEEIDESYVCRYSGHCNLRTVKSVSFFGPNQEYVMSGSDDGNIFIWEKKTGDLINLIKGDKHVVNVLSGHPFDPVLATVGIDNSVKIFTPILPQMNPLENSESIIQDNLDRLESGPVRPMAIPMALLRRLFQSVHTDGVTFGIDSSEDDDDSDNENAEVDIEVDDEDSGDNDDDDVDEWIERRDRPDGCPMQ